MAIHPVEYRYGSEDMRRVFSRDSWVGYACRVEYALLEALVEMGLIPLGREELEGVRDRFFSVSYEDVARLEKRFGHEVFALVWAIYERVGEPVGRYLHLGLTSNDVLDNVAVMQARDGLEILLRRIDVVVDRLRLFVTRYASTPLLGRTHGRAATPITVGFRFSVYLDELLRARDGLARMLDYLPGKIGGAVGSGVEMFPHSLELEKRVLEKLGLRRARAYLQVLPRDYFSRLLSEVIHLSAVLEHLNNEVRMMMRSGVEELYEEADRVGSSVMPHKRNPVDSEKVCGLARYLRGLLAPVYENIVFEDERDLRNSSLERIVIPEAFLLVDEQLVTTARVLERLRVDEARCIENIRKEGMNIYSNVLLHMGVSRGGDRQVLHERLRRIFRTRVETPEELLKLVMEDDYLSKYLTEEDIRRATDLSRYVDACLSRLDWVFRL